MFAMRVFWLTLLICCITAEKCPGNPELIAPCHCEIQPEDLHRFIYCDGDKSLDFIKVFNNLSHQLSGQSKHFPEIRLSNYNITEIPDYAFSDIEFGTINILYAKNLRHINPLAFNGTQVLHIDISYTPIENILNEFGDDDFFDSIKNAPSLSRLTIMNTNLTSIPANAFRDHPKLSEISISGHANLKSIESNAFTNMTNIEDILVYYNNITTVAESAFHVSPKFDQRNLRLCLNWNRLNESVITPGTFNNINRTVQLELIHDGYQYLPEKIYEGLLKQDPNNKIVTRFDLADCGIKGNDWLRSKYSKQWVDINCVKL